MRSDLPSARSRRLALGSSDGWTLIELLLTMSLALVIMGAAGTVLYAVQKSSNSDTENSNAQVEAQTSLDRMVRELRQGTDVLQAADNQMTVQLNGMQVSYKCDAADPKYPSYNACFRLTAALGAALPSPSAGNLAISRVGNNRGAPFSATPVFAYPCSTESPQRPNCISDSAVDDSCQPGDEDYPGCLPDPTLLPLPSYAAVHLELPAAGERATGGRKRLIVLDSGFELRNVRYTQTQGLGS